MSESLNGEALAAEVVGVTLANDPRLALRYAAMVQSIAVSPATSLPKLMSSAELEAAYRFFSNPRVTPDEILSPHVAKTAKRCADQQRVLVVHDTTDFTYRIDGERQGLGRSRKTADNTFYGHFSLALSADGSRRPLGIAALMTWVRGKECSNLEHKRWLDQIEASQRTLEPGTHAIHVFDREGDDYHLFAELLAKDIHFVARASANRWTVDDDGVREKLKTALATVDHVAEREAPIARRPKSRSRTKAQTHPARAARVAKLCVSSTQLSLVRPANYGLSKYPTRGELPKTLTVNVVRVWEPDPPDDVPVEWILYTNEPVGTADEMLAIVDHYRARWTIEEYFKALKTGCAFERKQLQDYESLVNLLAVFAPIAYHVLLLRSQARATPDAPASNVVDQDELDVLRALGRRPLSASPTVREVMLAIAALGGHIKYAPDPGWLTLSRGYAELATLTRGWVAAKLQRPCDQR